MQSIRSIFGLMLATIALAHDLSAGPVYAAKWTRNGQEVLLYGDNHDTNIKNQYLEDLSIGACCKKLKKGSKASKKTLILVENCTFPPGDKVFGLNLSMFMNATYHFASSLSGPGLQAKSIDPRTIFDLMERALKHCLNITQYKKAYEEIENWTLAKILEWAICNLKFYAHFTSNPDAGKIFNEIAETFIKRKEILCKKICTDTGLSDEELAQVLVATKEQLIKNHDHQFYKIASWLIKNIDVLARDYNLEVVEAEALWQIAGMKSTCSKIIVIAGTHHVINLEKYLLKLGFKQYATEGQAYKDAYVKYVAANVASKNALDVNHSIRVSPLDPLDEFGQALFDNEILDAIEHFNKLPEEDESEKQKKAVDDFESAEKKLNALEPIPLVPFECFKWINESDQTNAKKRLREDELIEQPAKKKKLNPEDENMDTI